MRVRWRAGADGRTVERRAPEPIVYRRDQLLGHRPIRLRRRSDKIRLAAHLAVAMLLVGLSIGWVVPLHAVVLTLTASRGVHAADLLAVVFLAIATRSVLAAQHLGSRH